jgi:Orotidine 5'-phosphate decarboxylase / HUMPS family
MEFKKPSDLPQNPLDLVTEYRHTHIHRRSFLDHAPRFVVSGLTVGAVFEMMRPNYAWAQVGKETHPASARVLDQLRTRFMFQISVDVTTLQQGLGVASAALAGGVNIVEMGTPLLKNEGVSNVVPAFRKQFPKALLLADMKTMDGGASEARGDDAERKGTIQCGAVTSVHWDCEPLHGLKLGERPLLRRWPPH